MKSNFIYFFLICILSIAPMFGLYAQHTMAEKVVATSVKKDITFLVRKSDKAKNIALRFHVPFKVFAKLNHPVRKGQTVYIGKTIEVPVWLRRKNAVQSSSDFNLADYELNPDSLDIWIKEDFLCMAEIEADTIRKIAIDREIKKINRKIAAINQELDSIQEDGRQNLSMRDIIKMPMERARRVGNFKVGLQLDSLVKYKNVLAEERSKINLRVADYEYLVENAHYLASHSESGESRIIQIKEWADDPAKVARGNENKK